MKYIFGNMNSGKFRLEIWWNPISGSGLARTGTRNWNSGSGLTGTGKRTGIVFGQIRCPVLGLITTFRFYLSFSMPIFMFSSKNSKCQCQYHNYSFVSLHFEQHTSKMNIFFLKCLILVQTLDYTLMSRYAWLGLIWKKLGVWAQNC